MTVIACDIFGLTICLLAKSNWCDWHMAQIKHEIVMYFYYDFFFYFDGNIVNAWVCAHRENFIQIVFDEFRHLNFMVNVWISVFPLAISYRQIGSPLDSLSTFFLLDFWPMVHRRWIKLADWDCVFVYADFVDIKISTNMQISFSLEDDNVWATAKRAWSPSRWISRKIFLTCLWFIEWNRKQYTQTCKQQSNNIIKCVRD